MSGAGLKNLPIFLTNKKNNEIYFCDNIVERERSSRYSKSVHNPVIKYGSNNKTGVVRSTSICTGESVLYSKKDEVFIAVQCLISFRFVDYGD